MKIKLKCDMFIDGKEIKKGSIVRINEQKKEIWIKKGWGEIIKKEAKPKKETKELKLDSKETKDETNKD